MFCFTSRVGLALAVALLGWDSPLPLPEGAGASPPVVVDAAPAIPRNAPYLDIYSQGYSRFEIMDDEIVAHMSGGVDFAYMGYSGHAEELLYHHASQQAVASGDVRFVLGDLQLSSSRAVLDVAAGEAELGEPVYGKLSESGMILEAQMAHITFPAGQPPNGVEDIQAELSGGVNVFTITGSWLATGAVLLNGGEQWLKTDGPFALVISSKQLEQAQADVGTRWGATRITGGQAVLHYNEAGMLSQANIESPRIANDAGTLTADAAEVTRSGPVEGQEWGITLHGGPVVGHFADVDQEVELSCETLTGKVRMDGSIDAMIAGNVLLSTNEREMSGDQIDFMRTVDGKWSIVASRGLRLGFELADESMPLDGLSFLGVE